MALSFTHANYRAFAFALWTLILTLLGFDSPYAFPRGATVVSVRMAGLPAHQGPIERRRRAEDDESRKMRESRAGSGPCAVEVGCRGL